MKKSLLILFALAFILSKSNGQPCSVIATTINDSICPCTPNQLLATASTPQNCISFNGSSGYLTAPNSTSLNTIGNQLTISCWVNLTSTTTNQKILGKTTVSFNGGYLMGMQNGSIYFELWNSAATNYSLTVGTVSPNTWTQLALTYSAGGKMYAYVNGIKTDSVAVANLPVGSNTNPFVIGAAPWDVNFFHVAGQVDEVRVYNTALSANQIFNEMNRQVAHNAAGLIAYWALDAGTGTTAADYTANGNNLTLTNSPSWILASTCPVNAVFNYNWIPSVCLNASNIPNPVANCCTPGMHNYIVIVSDTASQCVSQDTASFYIRALPNVFIGNDTMVCSDSSPFPLNGTPSGGSYSGNGAIFGNFNPAIPGVSIDTIVYTYTDIHGCINSDSMMVEVTNCTGFSENASEKNISIFPNPSSGKFFLKTNYFQKENALIRIENLFGGLIFSGNYKSGDSEVTIDLSWIASGMYFVTLATNEGNIQRKIVIEK